MRQWMRVAQKRQRQGHRPCLACASREACYFGSYFLGAGGRSGRLGCSRRGGGLGVLLHFVLLHRGAGGLGGGAAAACEAAWAGSAIAQRRTTGQSGACSWKSLSVGMDWVNTPRSARRATPRATRDDNSAGHVPEPGLPESGIQPSRGPYSAGFLPMLTATMRTTLLPCALTICWPCRSGWSASHQPPQRHACQPAIRQVLERVPARAMPTRGRATCRPCATAWRADPRNAELAVRLAARYFDEAAAEGDPRYIGYAQAALAPWWDAARRRRSRCACCARCCASTATISTPALADLDAAVLRRTRQTPRPGRGRPRSRWCGPTTRRRARAATAWRRWPRR